MLERTEQFAIIIDPSHENYEVGDATILVGLGGNLVPSRSHSPVNFWAFYTPKTCQSLAEVEQTENIQLSPQLKQMLLRANGAPMAICPYFYPAEHIQKGSLARLYEEFWHELDSPIDFERLTAFVSLYEDGLGNEQGFFSDEETKNNEYTIYDWNHETANFTIWAPTFASWLEQLLIRGW
jgi:hypothetical protein